MSFFCQFLRYDVLHALKKDKLRTSIFFKKKTKDLELFSPISTHWFPEGGGGRGRYKNSPPIRTLNVGAFIFRCFQLFFKLCRNLILRLIPCGEIPASFCSTPRSNVTQYGKRMQNIFKRRKAKEDFCAHFSQHVFSNIEYQRK